MARNRSKRLFTVVHFDGDELAYTDVLAYDESDARSNFDEADVFDVMETSFVFMFAYTA